MKRSEMRGLETVKVLAMQVIKLIKERKIHASQFKNYFQPLIRIKIY